jgi:hypothetical protein
VPNGWKVKPIRANAFERTIYMKKYFWQINNQGFEEGGIIG